MKRYLFILIGIVPLLCQGCITSQSYISKFSPPSKPLPIDAYEMVFTPSDSQTYSPSQSDPYPPFKMTWAYAGQSPTVNRDEKITRPYAVIGKIVLKLNWYDDETIAKLIRLYVPQNGGDAVSSYHMAQEAVAAMKDPDTGRIRTYYCGTIYLEIIRYTDRQGR